jgi:hypothetical protein
MNRTSFLAIHLIQWLAKLQSCNYLQGKMTDSWRPIVFSLNYYILKDKTASSWRTGNVIKQALRKSFSSALNAHQDNIIEVDSVSFVNRID